MQSEISLIAVLLLMLIADLILNESRYKARRNIACGLLIAHIILNLVPYTADAFGGMYHNTTMTSVVKTLLTMGTLLVFLQADSWLQRPDTRKKSGEFYVLTVSTLLGMYYMLTAANFLMFYVGLELASIPMACLVTLDKVRHHSAEAGAKFILSAMFSSALMLFGLSFIYGTCGTLYFDDLATRLTATPLQIAALVLSFAGFFSKFFVFASAFHAGHWLVVFLALVNTIISLFYYLLIVKAMYIVPNDNPLPTFKSTPMVRAALFICLMGVILLGVCSSVYQLLSDSAIASLQ